MTVLDGVRIPMERTAALNKWKNLGHVLAGGNGDVVDIEGKPELKEAYELGRSIK